MTKHTHEDSHPNIDLSETSLGGETLQERLKTSDGNPRTLEELNSPLSLFSFLKDIEEILQEIQFDEQLIPKVVERINFERTKSKIDILTKIFDDDVATIGAMKELDDSTLQLSDKVRLLGKVIFALKIIDWDTVLAEEVFFNKAPNKSVLNEIEIKLENFFTNIAFKEDGYLKKLLKDEFDGKNSSGKTLLLKGFLEPFLKVYDEGHFDNLFESVVRIVKSKFFNPNPQIADLSYDGLTRREHALLGRLAQTENISSEDKSDYNDTSKNHVDLVAIISNIQAPQERLTALQTFVYKNPKLSFASLRYLLSSIHTGQDWGDKDGNLLSELIEKLNEYSSGNFKSSGFQHTDIYILYKALTLTTKGYYSQNQIDGINSHITNILDKSLYLKGASGNFKGILKAYLLHLSVNLNE